MTDILPYRLEGNKNSDVLLVFFHGWPGMKFKI